jgi:hypothetical protein
VLVGELAVSNSTRRGSSKLFSAGGGSELTRRLHDSGGPTLRNHQLGAPPPPR